MDKAKLSYFEKEDILHLAITEESESSSVELSPNVTGEMNEKGELIGIEILNASTFIRDFVLDSVQVKMLQLFKPLSADHSQLNQILAIV